MRISWTSAQAEGVHSVQWGMDASALNNTAAASSHSYGPADLCGFPANESGWHHPGAFHEAVVSFGLYGSSDVFYRVGGDHGWSSVRSFRVPTAANPHGSLSMIITADMGETYEDGSQYHWEEPAATNTTVHIAKMLAHQGGSGVDIVFHPGDLAYATGYESEWDRFMAQIEPISSYVPYMTGMGNHERDFPGRCARQVWRRAGVGRAFAWLPWHPTPNLLPLHACTCFSSRLFTSHLHPLHECSPFHVCPPFTPTHFTPVPTRLHRLTLTLASLPQRKFDRQRRLRRRVWRAYPSPLPHANLPTAEHEAVHRLAGLPGR